MGFLKKKPASRGEVSRTAAKQGGAVSPASMGVASPTEEGRQDEGSVRGRDSEGRATPSRPTRTSAESRKKGVEKKRASSAARPSSRKKESARRSKSPLQQLGKKTTARRRGRSVTPTTPKEAQKKASKKSASSNGSAKKVAKKKKPPSSTEKTPKVANRKSRSSTASKASSASRKSHRSRGTKSSSLKKKLQEISEDEYNSSESESDSESDYSGSDYSHSESESEMDDHTDASDFVSIGYSTDHTRDRRSESISEDETGFTSSHSTEGASYEDEREGNVSPVAGLLDSAKEGLGALGTLAESTLGQGAEQPKSKSKSKEEEGVASKADNKAISKAASKAESKAGSKAGSKSDGKADAKEETKTDIKGVDTDESETSSKRIPSTSSRASARVSAATTSTYDDFMKKMRAFEVKNVEHQLKVQVTENGNVEKLELQELAYIPKPNTPADIVIKVDCSTITLQDCMIRRGKWYEMQSLPFVPGSDFVGTVAYMGKDAGRYSTFKIGDKVAACVPSGGNAKYIVVPYYNIIRVPPGADSVVALCLLSNYVPAREALDLARKLNTPFTGANVLVIGGNGPSGLATIELALLEGANVFATADERHHEYLSNLGATCFPIDPNKWLPTLQGKMDVVLDSVCLDGFESSSLALNSAGTLVCTGMSAVYTQGQIRAGFLRDVRDYKATYCKMRAKYVIKNSVYYDRMERYNNAPNEYAQHFRYLCHLASKDSIKPLVSSRSPLNLVAVTQRCIEHGDTSYGVCVCTPWATKAEQDPEMVAAAASATKEEHDSMEAVTSTSD